MRRHGPACRGRTEDRGRFSGLPRARLMTLAAALFAALVMGTTPHPAAAQDCDLDSVCRSLTAHEVTAGSFVMKRRIASLPRELASSGSFVICGGGIAWNTTSPIQTLLAVTEDRIIQQLPDGSRNVMDGAGNQTFRSIAATLSSLFSGDRDALEESFHVAFSSSGGSWTMTLRPKDSGIAAVMPRIIMEGRLAQEGGESFLNGLTIEEDGGGRISYSFFDQEHRDSLTDHEKAYFAAD